MFFQIKEGGLDWNIVILKIIPQGYPNRLQRLQSDPFSYMLIYTTFFLYAWAILPLQNPFFPTSGRWNRCMRQANTTSYGSQVVCQSCILFAKGMNLGCVSAKRYYLSDNAFIHLKRTKLLVRSQVVLMYDFTANNKMK